MAGSNRAGSAAKSKYRRSIGVYAVANNYDPRRILESFWQIFSPFCAQAIVKRLACTGDLWKRLLSPEWDASIDHDAGIAAVVLSVVAHRVERRTPAPMNDIDLIARIAARAHRPDYVVEVGRIDVIVDHDGPAVVVGARMAMRGDHGGLLGMAAVERLDRDHEQEPAAAGFVRPHALHAGDAGGFELVPHR